jgi:hypothetical protein
MVAPEVRQRGVVAATGRRRLRAARGDRGAQTARARADPARALRPPSASRHRPTPALPGLQGLQLRLRLGVSLAFVPHEFDRRLRFHRTMKSADLDLFEAASDEFVQRGETERRGFLAAGYGADVLRRDASEAWELVTPRVVGVDDYGRGSAPSRNRAGRAATHGSPALAPSGAGADVRSRTAWPQRRGQGLARRVVGATRRGGRPAGCCEPGQGAREGRRGLGTAAAPEEQPEREDQNQRQEEDVPARCDVHHHRKGDAAEEQDEGEGHNGAVTGARAAYTSSSSASP